MVLVLPDYSKPAQNLEPGTSPAPARKRAEHTVENDMADGRPAKKAKKVRYFEEDKIHSKLEVRVGLMNPSGRNICYMNSLFQILLHIPSINAGFAQGPPPIEKPTWAQFHGEYFCLRIHCGSFWRSLTHFSSRTASDFWRKLAAFANSWNSATKSMLPDLYLPDSKQTENCEF